MLEGCVVVYVLCEVVVSGCVVFHTAVSRPLSQEIPTYEPGLGTRLRVHKPKFENYIYMYIYIV